MGWTKHLDAVQAHQEGRRSALKELKTYAKALEVELDCPDLGGILVFGLGCDLHSILKQFVAFQTAVGGDEEVDLKPYFSLVLDAVTEFKWKQK